MYLPLYTMELMMIKITDGREVFEVTKGAFETVFKNQG